MSKKFLTPIDVPSGTDPTHAVNKSQLDGGMDDRVAVSGDVMTGALGMSNQQIYGVGAPTNADHAANKAYADTKADGNHNHLYGIADWDVTVATGMWYFNNVNPPGHQPENGWWVGINQWQQGSSQVIVVQTLHDAQATAGSAPKTWRRTRVNGVWGAWFKVTEVPGGPAGGDLTGTYPNPEIGAGKVTSTELGYDSVYPDHLAATGTPSSTTFLRGDNTWAVPPSGGGGGIPPYGVAEQSSGVSESLANSALEQIPLTLKESSDITWSANEFVITQAGLYAVSGGGTIALGGSAGRRLIEVTQNTALLARFEINTSIRTTGNVYRLVRLAVGDALRLQALQTSGGALDFSSAWLALHRIIA